LYATDSAERRNVAVPLRHGVERLTGIDDLIINMWIPRSLAQYSDCRHVRVTEYPPQSSLQLANDYTILFVPPSRRPGTPLNENPALRTSVPWFGNILVLKHGQRKPIINMLKSEGMFIDNIVTWCVPSSFIFFAVPHSCFSYIEMGLLR
jgi:hypothetical protein